MSKPTYGEMRTRAQRIFDWQIKERVLAGIEVLREKHGDSFVDYIDCATLDLSDGAWCVLGQLYGGYVEGVRVICPTGLGSIDQDIWAEDHGFYLPLEEGDDGGEYEDLTEAWLTVLCDKEEISGGAS